MIKRIVTIHFPGLDRAELLSKNFWLEAHYQAIEQ